VVAAATGGGPAKVTSGDASHVPGPDRSRPPGSGGLLHRAGFPFGAAGPEGAGIGPMV